MLTNKKNIEVVGKVASKELNLSKESADALQKGLSLAQKMSHVYFGTEHLFVAILESKSRKIQKLSQIGLTAKKFKNELNKIATYPLGILAKPSQEIIPEENMGIMEYLGTDLVQLARENKLDPVVGREKEIDQLVNILSRRKKNNPIVVGEAGVGKTVLIEGLAQRIANRVVHPSLSEAKIVSLDVASIVAGSKMRGDVEEKIMSIIEEVTESNNTILFIDEIHNIINSGGFGPS